MEKRYTMRLVHRSIPREFLEVLPEGMKFIHHNGHEFLVVEELTCPAGHTLMSESVRIHGESSIAIAIRRAGATSRLFVDAFWGSHAKLYDFLPEPGESLELAEAVCPACGVSLLVTGSCSEEGCDSAKRIELQLPRAGDRISVCARVGCPDHRLEVGGVPKQVNELVNEINFFGYGEDEQFNGI